MLVLKLKALIFGEKKSTASLYPTTLVGDVIIGPFPFLP